MQHLPRESNIHGSRVIIEKTKQDGDILVAFAREPAEEERGRFLNMPHLLIPPNTLILQEKRPLAYCDSQGVMYHGFSLKLDGKYYNIHFPYIYAISKGLMRKALGELGRQEKDLEEGILYDNNLRRIDLDASQYVKIPAQFVCPICGSKEVVFGGHTFMHYLGPVYIGTTHNQDLAFGCANGHRLSPYLTMPVRAIFLDEDYAGYWDHHLELYIRYAPTELRIRLGKKLFHISGISDGIVNLKESFWASANHYREGIIYWKRQSVGNFFELFANNYIIQKARY